MPRPFNVEIGMHRWRYRAALGFAAAILAAPVTGSVASTVVPSRNWTLPVAVVGEIAAVMVTWRLACEVPPGATTSAVLVGWAAAGLTTYEDAADFEAP